MSNLVELSDATFKNEVLESSTPVLVDFTAAWCAPCHMLAPIVDQLAVEWAGKVKVARLDIDENLATTVAYGVMGVPTLILFVGGQPKERLTGFVPKDKILAKLKPHLN